MNSKTPKYGHAPIPMKRLPDNCGWDVDNVGEFSWSEENGIPFITVALPSPTATTPDNYIMNFIPVSKGKGVPGKWDWDGNEDLPTLAPSLHCDGHWHGFIRGGFLVEA
jgi:hypothetical protein